MIGMPPGAGFITKWYLILAALDAGQYVFVGAIFFSTLLMIVYFWRVIEIMYIRPPETNQASQLLRPGCSALHAAAEPAYGCFDLCHRSGMDLRLFLTPILTR